MVKYAKQTLVVFIGAFLILACSKDSDSDGFIPPAAQEEPNEEEPKEEPTPTLGTDATIPSFVLGEDPNTSNLTWSKVDLLSDEFEGTALDEVKWGKLGTGWRGRTPGIFKEDAISLANGDMKITNYKLDTPEGDYTHAGSLVRSKITAKPGMYLECRMKASKTFMSSTFWLINNRGEGTGCDKRTTELDIQETVGRISETTPSWAHDHDAGMFSNTHSRNKTCDETKEGSVGSKVNTTFKCWEDYHIYACWWKSPTEVLFFLDGKLQKQVTPAEKFDLPMYLRMVTETYDWNPVPSDGGLTGTEEERTTYYDWVRTWELK
ncbi:family 16 glycosylhydrolase [Wenyingzhuangia sp. IMCC45574]